MLIRPAVPTDKPEMIELLRKSLGDSTIPKSEPLWNWKHEENPFGSSYVLLATENEKIIGLRAFMKWNWSWNGKNYRAIRAVDTATHPDFQGKGIFKKLTLRQLELCKEDGVDFVFNTPNTQSMPGYLKMGWQVQGKMPVKMSPTRPIGLAKAFLKKRGEPGPRPPISSDWKSVVNALGTKSAITPSGITTPYSAAYLKWRYANNPLFDYHFISDNENYLLTYRFKPHDRYLELRLTDFYLFNDQAKVRKHLNAEIKKIKRSHKPDMITMSGAHYPHVKKYLGFLGPFPVLRAGPTVTLRDVNAGENFNKFMDYKNWTYSMGDLELF